MDKKKLNVKPIKQMCSVPGCSNRGSYTMARTRYFGGVNVCEDCIREALELIAPPQIPEIPPLDELLLDDKFKQQFEKAVEERIKKALECVNGDDIPGDTVDSGAEDTQTNDGGETPQEKNLPPEQTDPETKKFICSKCGKVCGSQIGLTSHERACKPE